MANWYTADLHFGHDNIMRHCARPFRSTGEMDAMMIANIAARVRPSDDLWIVGDFAFGRSASKDGAIEAAFERLPGNKHLIVGNHDDERVRALSWVSVHDLVELKDGDQHLTLCHYPMITWNKARRGALQLFGHVHGNWRGSRNSINVGVDVWDFMPIEIRDIQRRAGTLPPNKHWDDVEPRSALD